MLGTFSCKTSNAWNFSFQNFQTLELFLPKPPNLGTFDPKIFKHWNFSLTELPRFGDFLFKISNPWNFCLQTSKSAPISFGTRLAPTDVGAAWELFLGELPDAASRRTCPACRTILCRSSGILCSLCPLRSLFPVLSMFSVVTILFGRSRPESCAGAGRYWHSVLRNTFFQLSFSPVAL